MPPRPRDLPFPGTRVRCPASVALPIVSLLALGALVAPPVPAAEASEPLPLEAWFVRRELLWDEGPAVSPDGRRVAYTVVTPRPGESGHERYLPNGTPGNVPGARIELVDLGAAAAREAREVCPEGGDCWRPSWSPDGRRLAFYSNSGGPPQLWIHDLESEASRRLAEAAVKAKIWPGDEPRWSPDGRHLYVPLAPEESPADPAAGAPPEGGQHRAPAGVTVTVRRSGAETEGASEEETRDPRGSFFVEENAARLAAVEAGTGEVRVLVPVGSDPVPSVLRLSPSGRWVSYLSVFRHTEVGSQEVVFDLAVTPAAGGPVHVLAEELPVSGSDYFGGSYRWHPTEDRLVYLRDGELRELDLRTGLPEPAAPGRRLGAALGPLAEAPLLFASDGLVVVGVAGGGDGEGPVEALALVPLERGGDPAIVPLADPGTASFREVVRTGSWTAWQPAPSSLTFLQEDRATGEVVATRATVATGQRRELWRRFGRLSGAVGAGDALLAVYEDTGTPQDVYRFDATLSSSRRVSTLEPALDAVRGLRVELLATEVPGPDGALERVRTAVLLPAGAPPRPGLPAVVAIYPGSRVSRSASAYGGGDFADLPSLLWTSRGYAVVLPDLPLGATGRPGAPLRETVDALLPQLHRAAEAGLIDLGRLGLTGQSYGGYGTAGVISRTGLFRAAVAISGIYDLPGTWGRLTGSGVYFFRDWAEGGQARMGSHPWAELPRYLENSPYYQANAIHTPLLLLHGSKDDAVDDARKLFAALDRLERTVQYAEYEGEGHVVGEWRLANAADAARRAVEFFERYLGRP